MQLRRYNTYGNLALEEKNFGFKVLDCRPVLHPKPSHERLLDYLDLDGEQYFDNQPLAGPVSKLDRFVLGLSLTVAPLLFLAFVYLFA